MSTNEFARILLTWIKSFLSWIGIPRDRLNELDEIIFLILIVVIAFAVGAVFHYLSVRFTRKVLKYKNISFLSSLIEYNALRKMDAATIVSDAMTEFISALSLSDLQKLDERERQELARELLSPQLNGLFVTPKNIDDSIKNLSFLISEGLNIALLGDKEE